MGIHTHAKTSKASEITSGRFPVDRLPAMTDEKIWKGTGANVEEVDMPAGGAWALAEVEIDSSTCGASDNVWWDWDFSAITGGGYFLGLFLMQKSLVVDSNGVRTNGNPDFKGQTYGYIETQQYTALDAGDTLACWIFSDANSVVEVRFDDVSDRDKAMLIAYMKFTPPRAWV